jgi:3-oxoacyl-[acyl-carrier protein] reductase
MNLDLTGRVALVTGGGRGIGRAIAEGLAASGAAVVINYRGNSAAAEETVAAIVAAGGKASAIQADVSVADDVERLVKAALGAHGRLDIHVNNAGITRDTLLMRMSDEDFDTVVETNLGGSFRVVKRASKGMIKAKFGRIILVSSVVGLLGGAGQVNYSSSKAGLVGMARSITRELGSRGITANVVAPGFIETDMTAELPDEKQAEYKKSIPAGRFASPSEVAKVIAWLASDDAAYISGAVIPVDGGLGMGH